jgi:hypothetical protein
MHFLLSFFLQVDIPGFDITFDEFGRTVYSFPVHIRVLLAVTALFLLIILILLGVILASRIFKTHRATRKKALRTHYQKIFRELLFEDNRIWNDSFEQQFNKKDLENKFNRSVIMHEIIHLHTNFTGETAERLEEIFRRLGFHADSMEKLRNRRWYIVAKGMRELALMNIKEAFPQVSAFLNSKNEILRMESRLSMMKLSESEPLLFLSKQEQPLTDWDTANIYSILSKMPEKSIPDFSHWLNSSNKDVVLFCIRMIGTFKQNQSVDVLIHLLGSDNKRIRIASIKSLREMGASAAEGKLIDLYWLESEDIQREILKTLELIGTDKSAALLEKILRQPMENYNITVQTVRALLSFGDSGKKIVKEVFDSAGPRLQLVIRHAEDRRL